MDFKFLPLLTALSAGIAGFATSRISAFAKEATSSGSLTRLTEAARVEPIVLVDATAADQSDLASATLETALNIFAAFYLQAIALSNVTVSGVQIINRLSSYNPSRDVKFSSVMGSASGTGLQAAFENIDDVSTSVSRDTYVLPEDFYEESLPSFESFNAKTSDVIKDAPQLAVGKVFDVEMREKGETFNVPVIIRFSAAKIMSNKLAEALIVRFGQEESALDRKMGWKSGRLGYIRDILLCSDKVREHRKRLMYDSDGLYAKLNPSKLSATTSTLYSGQPSLAKASNVLVLDAETARQIETHLGGSFDKVNFRQRLLENTGIMILAIIDREWEQVTFYYDGIEHSNTVRGSDLAKSNKKNGPDVTEILTALVGGKAPLR